MFFLLTWTFLAEHRGVKGANPLFLLSSAPPHTARGFRCMCGYPNSRPHSYLLSNSCPSVTLRPRNFGSRLRIIWTRNSVVLEFRNWSIKRKPRLSVGISLGCLQHEEGGWVLEDGQSRVLNSKELRTRNIFPGSEDNIFL